MPVNHEIGQRGSNPTPEPTSFGKKCGYVVVRNAAHSESFALFESSEVRAQRLKDKLGGREIAMTRLQDWLVESLNRGEPDNHGGDRSIPRSACSTGNGLQTWQRRSSISRTESIADVLAASVHEVSPMPNNEQPDFDEEFEQVPSPSGAINIGCEKTTRRYSCWSSCSESINAIGMNFGVARFRRSISSAADIAKARRGIGADPFSNSPLRVWQEALLKHQLGLTHGRARTGSLAPPQWLRRARRSDWPAILHWKGLAVKLDLIPFGPIMPSTRPAILALRHHATSAARWLASGILLALIVALWLLVKITTQKTIAWSNDSAV